MYKIEFTSEQIAYIREHFPTEAACDIADVLHVSPPVVSRIARDMGLEKSSEWDKRSYYGRYVKRKRKNVVVS